MSKANALPSNMEAEDASSESTEVILNSGAKSSIDSVEVTSESVSTVASSANAPSAETEEIANNNNDGLVSNTASASPNSYAERLRRKMLEARSQRPTRTHQPTVEEEKTEEMNVTYDGPISTSNVTSGEAAPPSNGGTLNITDDETTDDEETPGAFSATGRALGAFPTWWAARRRSSLLQSASSDESRNRERNNANILSAVIVDESMQARELENKIRQQIKRESVTPELVEKVESPRERRIRRFVFIIIAIAALATIIGLAVGLRKQSDNDAEEETLSPTATPAPTLQLVTEAGVLKCGGFETFDLCRAVAAAVLGPPGLIELLSFVSPTDRFAALANGTVHLVDGTTPTMERDIYQKHAKAGFSFTTPYLYDGLTFGGVPEFVRCADELDTFGDCSDLKICVSKDTTYFDFLDLRLPASAIITTPNISQGLIEKSCNVIASIGALIAEPVVRFYGYLGNYTIGKSKYLKDPLSLMTRDDDPEWSDFVNSVLRSLFTAEMMNITQRTARNFTTTSVFGDEYENMFINAIASVGNYGEIYARKMEFLIPRSVINSLNTNGSTGLIYSLPFGDIERIGPVPGPKGTLERILKRGKLLCGIQPNRPGFAQFNTTTQTYIGLDVDYCHTLASSIFRSNRSAVEFVPFATGDVGGIFVALANESIDVATGIGITLERDVREPATGKGFAFSEPYFYQQPEGPLENTSSLVTRQDDPQWSAYVYWIVIATFYAEEKNLTHDLSFQMPLVGVLGPDNTTGLGFARMLRDAILVGNYGELYERNVEEFIPRSGRNMLNEHPFGPQINPYFVYG